MHLLSITNVFSCVQWNTSSWNLFMKISKQKCRMGREENRGKYIRIVIAYITNSCTSYHERPQKKSSYLLILWPKEGWLNLQHTREYHEHDIIFLLSESILYDKGLEKNVMYLFNHGIRLKLYHSTKMLSVQYTAVLQWQLQMRNMTLQSPFWSPWSPSCCLFLFWGH